MKMRFRMFALERPSRPAQVFHVEEALDGDDAHIGTDSGNL